MQSTVFDKTFLTSFQKEVWITLHNSGQKNNACILDKFRIARRLDRSSATWTGTTGLGHTPD